MASPITYDRRSFKRDGKPILILSGSVHYIRLHPSRWDDLFDTFIRAKLNTLETYVFWGEHDRSPPVTEPLSESQAAARPPSYDFSSRLDLFGFIAAAGAKGLNVILRIGPYVCAEVSYGGFPFRLRNVPDIQFRTFNKPFMDEVETWVRYVASGLKSENLLAPAGGPVILVQLENEYSMVSDAYGDVGAKYLQWCADLQKDLSFGVPAIMCYGAANGVVETINAFYAHKEIDEHRKRHADQPPVWTECWTGWYDVWGAPHHRRAVEDLAYAVARFFAQGGAGVNYYMWMGGTNFGRSPMYLQATSYDYDAPIDEFYQETTKSRHLARLHTILLEVFAEAFHAKREDDPVFQGGRVIRWGDACFVCNDSEERFSGVALPGGNLEYSGVVQAKSVHIVDARSAKLLFDTAQTAESDTLVRDRIRLGSKAITDWEAVAEPMPRPGSIKRIAEQSNGARRIVITDLPEEQLRLTQDSSDYCFYTAKYERIATPGVTMTTKTAITFEAKDFAQVFFDGLPIGRSEEPLWEDRWPNKWNAYMDGEGAPGARHSMQPEVAADKQSLDVSVMTAALGLVKGDWQLGSGRKMEDERKGLLSDVELEGWRRVSQWYAVGKLHGEVLQYGAGGTAPWSDGSNLGRPAWFKSVVELDKVSGSVVLDLGECGKGMLYINGVLLGRFWNVSGVRPKNGFLDGAPVKQVGFGSMTQRFYHIPAWAMGAGTVEIVLFVEFGAPPGELRFFTVEQQPGFSC